MNEYDEIDLILNNPYLSNDYFLIRNESFSEGWALFIEERMENPRRIVVSKNIEGNYFGIRSFQIHYKKNGKELVNEIYRIEHIFNIKNLLKELVSIMFGKDLIMQARQAYLKYFP